MRRKGEEGLGCLGGYLGGKMDREWRWRTQVRA